MYKIYTGNNIVLTPLFVSNSEYNMAVTYITKSLLGHRCNLL